MCSMIPGNSARAGGLGRSEPDALASGLEGETGRENSIMTHNGVRTSETQRQAMGKIAVAPTFSDRRLGSDQGDTGAAAGVSDPQ